MEQLMYRPAESEHVLGTGRTAVFALIKSGRTPEPTSGGDDPWT
jgi:hypothetical protein